jgi:hypothetical protein
MNLAVLKKSRRGPHKGDIFVMSPADRLFLYGRVISTEARVGPMKNSVLIYIYDIRSSGKLPIPELSPDMLLVPPVLTNRLPWRHGYFETLVNKELTESDQLKKHCFRSLSTGKYYDEFNHELDGPVERVGIRALSSFRSIDDKISKALGIPLAPSE